MNHRPACMRLSYPASSAFIESVEFASIVPLPDKYCRIYAEPRWRSIRKYTTAQLPPQHRHWLLDDSSLTNRLIELNRGRFSVQRLLQGWQTPLPSESRLLAVPPRQRALVREVSLKLDEQTVVFARSVFPISSLQGELAHLRYLQNKSLGSILFGHPDMRRSPFELAHIPGDSDYLPPHLQQDSPAWGRRSRFILGGRSLMVSEIFLQAFTPWPTSMRVHRAQRGKVNAAIVRTTK